MQKKEMETFSPKSQAAWRKWLAKNHKTKESIWLVLYKKESGKPVIRWSDAVDEALCFGWVDSKRQPLDEEKFRQFFCQRKPSSTWSKINKDKVQRLIDEGRMTEAGLDCIDVAKKNGTWNILDTVEELEVRKDLAKAFRAQPGSKKFFESLSRSVKKMMLSWLVLAKRPETRAKRVSEIAKLAAKGKKPKGF